MTLFETFYIILFFLHTQRCSNCFDPVLNVFSVSIYLRDFGIIPLKRGFTFFCSVRNDIEINACINNAHRPLTRLNSSGRCMQYICDACTCNVINTCELNSTYQKSVHEMWSIGMCFACGQVIYK